MLSGYFFWFILSKITSPEVIGIASAVVSFSSIFAIIVAIGVPVGVQRFLGKSFADQNVAEAGRFIKASFVMVSAGIVASTVAMILVKDWLIGLLSIDFNLLIIALVLIASSAITTLLRSIVIASLKTKTLPAIMLVSVIIKIILAIGLVMEGYGALGATLGYTAFPVLASILLTVNMILIFRSYTNSAEAKAGKIYKSIVSSSMTNWIPSLVTTIGAQLGTIIVFGSQGANEAGIYFIALSLTTAIIAVVSVPTNIAYPALSGMKDGRKKLTWKITKLSLVIAMPISSAILFFAEEVMLLFGQEYGNGSISLQVLLLSIAPTAIATSVFILSYAYGNYRQALIIGLSQSIPRTFLYFILIIPFGSIGAAAGYTIGALIGFIASLVIANRMGLKIFWKDIAIIIVIPTILAFVLDYSRISYLISMPVIVVISYIIYIRLQVLNRDDLQDSLDGLPNSIKIPLSNAVDRIAGRSER